VTSIGLRAFYNCRGLTSIDIPKSVTLISSGAFLDCSGLTSITVPNSVTSIGNFAFDGTAWLKNQPDGVVYAGNVAYTYKGTMPKNTQITIKDGTLSISSGAFWDSSGLTSVTIPNSVTSIGDNAFTFCSGLTEIVSLIEEPFAVSCWNFVNKDIPLYIPKGTKELYQSTEGWKDFFNIIEIEKTGIELLTPDTILKSYGNKTALGIYTLQGVKVADDVERLKELPHGIYIVNGKKVRK